MAKRRYPNENTPHGIMGIPAISQNDPAVEYSNVLILRMNVMAQYILDHHQDDFAEVWGAKYPGSADPHETLLFFANPHLHEVLIMMRRVNL